MYAEEAGTDSLLEGWGNWAHELLNVWQESFQFPVRDTGTTGHVHDVHRIVPFARFLFHGG